MSPPELWNCTHFDASEKASNMMRLLQSRNTKLAIANLWIAENNPRVLGFGRWD